MANDNAAPLLWKQIRMPYHKAPKWRIEPANLSKTTPSSCRRLYQKELTPTMPRRLPAPIGWKPQRFACRWAPKAYPTRAETTHTIRMALMRGQSIWISSYCLVLYSNGTKVFKFYLTVLGFSLFISFMVMDCISFFRSCIILRRRVSPLWFWRCCRTWW